MRKITLQLKFPKFPTKKEHEIILRSEHCRRCGVKLNKRNVVEGHMQLYPVNGTWIRPCKKCSHMINMFLLVTDDFD